MVVARTAHQRLSHAAAAGAVLVATWATVPAGGANAGAERGAATPSAPRSVSAVAGVSTVKVSWRKPKRAGDTRIDRYKVVRATSGAAKRTVKVAAGKRALLVSGLTAGKTYVFTVFAHNGSGWGRTSKQVSAVPTAPPPPPPPPPTWPKTGFGTISGPCLGVQPQLDDPTSSSFENRIDFHADPYDDADFALLTPGGQEILTDGNLGGSSLESEVFAYEVLARCEAATLVKTKGEIVYDVPGKTTDLSVQIGGVKVGVNAVRALSFPEGTSYTSSQATDVLTSQLQVINESSANVSAADAWVKQVMVVLAQTDQHATTIVSSWAGIDAPTKADTVLYVVVTDGTDGWIYYDT